MKIETDMKHIGRLLSRAKAVVGSSSVSKAKASSLAPVSSFRGSWRDFRRLLNQVTSFDKVYPGSVLWSSRNSASFCSLDGQWHPLSKVPGYIMSAKLGSTHKWRGKNERGNQ